MGTRITDDTRLSDAALAAELDRLGIAFVAFSAEDRPYPPPAPDTLVASLAMSGEARLRMALIPLFLALPDYACSATRVADVLSGQGRVTLICYYTASMLLQRKYARRLVRLGVDHAPLPDRFGPELALPPSDDVDFTLARLAERHAELSDQPLNWHGTYEQAAKRFIQRLEWEAKQAVSFCFAGGL